MHPKIQKLQSQTERYLHLWKKLRGLPVFPPEMMNESQRMALANDIRAEMAEVYRGMSEGEAAALVARVFDRDRAGR